MIKLVYCITKKPGMTDAEFSIIGRRFTAPSARAFLVCESWCKVIASMCLATAMRLISTAWPNCGLTTWRHSSRRGKRRSGALPAKTKPISLITVKLRISFLKSRSFQWEVKREWLAKFFWALKNWKIARLMWSHYPKN